MLGSSFGIYDYAEALATAKYNQHAEWHIYTQRQASKIIVPDPCREVIIEGSHNKVIAQ
jgi:hypothetical protein